FALVLCCSRVSVFSALALLILSVTLAHWLSVSASGLHHLLLRRAGVFSPSSTMAPHG
ncbi:hypothetical protein M9458_048160, partial [Cirrhinus mrigala]